VLAPFDSPDFSEYTEGNRQPLTGGLVVNECFALQC